MRAGWNEDASVSRTLLSTGFVPSDQLFCLSEGGGVLSTALSTPLPTALSTGVPADALARHRWPGVPRVRLDARTF